MQDIEVIILAGGREFGRCPVASRLPLAFWPFLGVSVLQRLLNSLSAEGIKHVVICSNGGRDLIQRLSDSSGIEIKYIDEELPLGTAGCTRDAAAGCSQQLIVLLSASMVSPPSVDMLIKAHCAGRSELSMFNSPQTDAKPAGIYVCDRTVLEHIPQGGYCDIKEGLVPELVKYGSVVKAVELTHDAGNFRDGPGYLRAVADYLEKEPPLDDEIPSLRRKAGQYVWLDEGAEIDPSAKFFGPVVVMAGAQVAKNAVVFGPSIIGRNCRLGSGSVVLNSVFWDGAKTGANCEVRNCLLDYDVDVADNTVIRDRVIPFVKTSFIMQSGMKTLKVAKDIACGLRNFLQQGAGQYGDASNNARIKVVPGIAWLAGAAIVAAFLWSYWPVIVDLWNIWNRSDEYSSGLLVPFLAGYVLWSRREQFKGITVSPSLWGLFALLFAEGLRLFGLYFMYGSAERLAVVVSIAAIVLFLFGWQFFKKTSTVLLFLCLMLPWPNRVQAAMALPLQSWATSSAVFCLETIGYGVAKEGNVIHIGQASVAVAEACNGLRMITAFFVISGLVVLLVKRQWWEKLIVLASSLPIALLCNTTRLVITAIAFTFVKGDYWEKIFHDFGGYAMVPLALAAVIGEFWLLRRLTVLPAERKAVIILRQ
jgi:exosortase